MRWSAVAWMLLFAVPRARAHAQAGPIYRASWWDAASVGAAGALFVLPTVLDLPKGPPSCGSTAPCDPATIPTVDRSALHTFSDGAGTASTALLAGVAGLTAFASLQGLPARQARGNFVMLANAAAWTAASSEWLKVVIRRKRPVLYTSGAAAAAADRESQQSLPSGHASLAFAAATSYLVLARRQHLPHRTRNAILLYAGAVGVSALRVAAGKHFPTDVAAGAALGSGIGWLSATVHPTSP